MITTTHAHVKTDLITVGILVVVIFATMIGLWYVDRQSGVFAQWSSTFYDFIMRR